ncbi:MAG: radical SAM family heme chaperone HemW [Acidimicrobiales bacterium]
MNESFGVYLHIPFCSRRCDYCAFATWSDRQHLEQDYLDAMATEISRVVDAGMLPPASSVFVGGGTPSLVDPTKLGDLLRLIPTTRAAEVSVECNPESVSAEHFAAYRSAGVNRISFGVQSMSERVLLSLGRDHNPEEVRRAVALARTGGIERVNLDLIYGGAGETIKDWHNTLEQVIELAPDHVSAYALTVEAGTPLADDPSRHPDDDDQADKYLLADERLSAAGFRNYEISNWAKPGQECEHNLLYWRQGNYRGFGCAAHSHQSGRRWWNVRTPERYIDLVSTNQSLEAAAELLEPERQRIEGLQLSLRTREGVPVSSLSASDRDLLGGLILVGEERIVLSAEGRLLANEVAVRLR